MWMIVCILGPSTLEERLFEEGLVGREGDLECRLKISMKAQVCGEKNLTSSRWMNLHHKRLDVPIRLVKAHREATLFRLGAAVWCRPKTIGHENMERKGGPTVVKGWISTWKLLV